MPVRSTAALALATSGQPTANPRSVARNQPTGRTRNGRSRVRAGQAARAHPLSVVSDFVDAGIPQTDAVSPGDPATDVNYIVSYHRVFELAELAKQQGWDLTPLLHSTGILWPSHRPRCLGVTKSALSQLLRELWEITNDELLGLGSHPVPRGTFRLLMYALVGAPTLESALARLQDCKQAVPGLPAVSLTTCGNVATLSIQSRSGTRADDIYTDSLVAATHRTMNWALGRPLPVLRVHLPRTRPHDPAEYESIFGAPVQFSAPAAALVFDRRVLTEPFARSDEEIEEFLRAAPDALMTSFAAYTSQSDRVRQIMKGCLDGRWGTAEDIAAHVGMSRQTLHRRLRDENTSLVDIKEEVLREAAVISLKKGEETISALSQRLGFSEPCAFSRAFRRWTGIPPSVYRTTAGARGTSGL